MRIGSLNHKIAFYKMQKSQDATGGSILTPVLFKAAYASINAVAGSEKYISQSIHAISSHKFMLRYTRDIDTSMQIYFRQRKFDITFIVNIGERNKTLIITAKERL
ncbi:MAG: phage head closure protein [Sulfurovum sp.]